jgi:hypothetical protein
MVKVANSWQSLISNCWSWHVSSWASWVWEGQWRKADLLVMGFTFWVKLWYYFLKVCRYSVDQKVDMVCEGITMSKLIASLWISYSCFNRCRKDVEFRLWLQFLWVWYLKIVGKPHSILSKRTLGWYPILDIFNIAILGIPSGNLT